MQRAGGLEGPDFVAIGARSGGADLEHSADAVSCGARVGVAGPLRAGWGQLTGGQWVQPPCTSGFHFPKEKGTREVLEKRRQRIFFFAGLYGEEVQVGSVIESIGR